MTTTLLNAVTTVGAGTGVVHGTVPANNSFKLNVTSVGDFTANVNIEQSTDNSTWTLVKAFSLIGSNAGQDSFSSTIIANNYVRGNVIGFTGTSVAISIVDQIQVPATVQGVVGITTADNAQSGSIEEYISAITSGATATVTVTIAAPGVVTWTAHGLSIGSAVLFTTTGALPTGITASTVYYVQSVPSVNTFTIAATVGGAAITTSGTQSGVQTGLSSVPLTTATPANVLGIILTPGDWDVRGSVSLLPTVSTSITYMAYGSSTTSATLPAAGVGLVSSSTSAFVPGAVAQADNTTLTRVNVSANTPVYLVASSTFTASTLNASGSLTARRVR